jgi:uncharacterized protein (DUF58 family)
MVASARLYWILSTALFLFLGSYWMPALQTVAIAIDVLVLLAVTVDYFITPPASSITAVRSVAEKLSIGRQNDVSIDLYSQSNKKLTCRVRDSYPRELETDATEFDFEIAGKSKATLTYHLLPRTRGGYDFGDIIVRYSSALRLFWRDAKIAAPRYVKVYPDLKALQELSVKLAHSSELGDMKARKRGQGTDFSSLREYVSGDDARSIDWKATARRDRPVSRVYEVDKEQTLMVLVDGGRMMMSDLDGLCRFDHALNAALSLVLTGLARNDQVGLGIFADKPILYMPPRRGKSYLTRMLEACCDVRPRMVEPDYLGALSYYADAHKSRSLTVVITDLTDPTGSQSLLSGLASLSPRHLPFCVTLRDRQVDNIAADKLLTTQAVFKRAIATDLIAQRELAFSHLARRGCLVLDCPPMDLSDKLVDRYLEIKARGLI